jgi:hypothetical protein
MVIGVAVTIIGVLSNLVPLPWIPKDLGLVLIGAGLGELLAEIAAAADRRNTSDQFKRQLTAAESRHQDQLQRTLSAFSGSTRQALRLGTALAEMMSVPDWPKPDERRYLMAMSKVLGVSEALDLIINNIEQRNEEAVEQFVLCIRGARGKNVAEAFKIGYRLERMARALESEPMTLTESSLAKHLVALNSIERKRQRSFPLDDRLVAWLARNLLLDQILAENRVPIVREALRMLWQSRHLQPSREGCECLDFPCRTRRRYYEIISSFPDARLCLAPATFRQSISDVELRMRRNEFEELKSF